MRISGVEVVALLCISLSCFPATHALAQTIPASKLELFGGYSLIRMSNDGLPQHVGMFVTVAPGLNAQGWLAAVTYNASRYFGATAEFNGQRSSGFFGSPVDAGTDLYNFFIGPTFAYRSSRKVTPFAHALFGVSRLTAPDYLGSATPPCLSTVVGHYCRSSDVAFGSVFGGGADVRLSRRFSIRVGQLDYLYTQHTLTQNHFRYSTGVTIALL